MRRRRNGRKSGLEVPSRAEMGAEDEDPRPPPPTAAETIVLTARNIRILCSNARALRQGRVSEGVVRQKSNRRVEEFFVEVAMLRNENEARSEAQDLDKATRGKKGKAIFHQNGFSTQSTRGSTPERWQREREGRARLS